MGEEKKGGIDGVVKVARKVQSNICKPLAPSTLKSTSKPAPKPLRRRGGGR